MKSLTNSGKGYAKVGFIVALSLAGISLLSASIYASLTATTSNTSGGSVNTGTLKLTQAASGVTGITGGFTTPITAMAPGDTVNRYINLTNGGTLDGAVLTLSTSASPSNALTTDGTNGLQVTVNECTVDWTASGTCTGTQTTALASGSLLSLGTAKTMSVTSLASSAVNHLQISLNLPAGSEVTTNGALPSGTVQGLTTAITWTFLETLRTNTTTNS